MTLVQSGLGKEAQDLESYYRVIAESDNYRWNKGSLDSGKLRRAVGRAGELAASWERAESSTWCTGQVDVGWQSLTGEIAA